MPKLRHSYPMRRALCGGIHTLLLSLLQGINSIEETSFFSQMCVSMDQIQCMLARNCTNEINKNEKSLLTESELLVGRIRFPGTASSDEKRMFRNNEVKQRLRFHDYQNLHGCDSSRICFQVENDSDLNLAFRKLSLSASFGAHLPYDKIYSAALDELDILNSNTTMTGEKSVKSEMALVTTLRDPGSYAVKWYTGRDSWDKGIGNLSNATCVDWMDAAPWRMNYLTRMLGSEADRKAVPRVHLIPTQGSDIDPDDAETFLQDAYMKEQNRLGPESSEVFQLAMERLKNEFVHFGLFHRLKDSWDLLSYRFCWNLGERYVWEGKDLRGVEAVKKLFPDNEQAQDMWSRLKERNRLDLGLLEAADKIMDERLQTMRFEKAHGILCNFLGRVKVTCEAEAVAPAVEL